MAPFLILASQIFFLLNRKEEEAKKGIYVNMIFYILKKEIFFKQMVIDHIHWE